MTDTNTPPLDLSRYEGHTPEPWKTIAQKSKYGDVDWRMEGPNEQLVFDCSLVAYEGGGTPPEGADLNLIADAPLLLAEVRRLRAALGFAHAAMIREREKHTKPPTLLRDAINHACRVLGEEVIDG